MKGGGISREFSDPRRSLQSTSFHMANSVFLILVPVLFNLRPIHAVIVQAARVPFEENNYTFSNVEFNVMKNEYSMLHKLILDTATRNTNYTELHEYIANATRNIANATFNVSVDELSKYKVLPRQTGHQSQPPEWILIDLAGWDNVTTIALRADNLYLVGFTDRNRHWHTFNGSEGLIPGSTALDFNGSYRGLGGRGMLRELPLNSTMVVTAVQKLIDYNNSSLTVKEQKEGLATVILSMCEGPRFRNVSANITSGWNSVSNISCPDILVQWSNLSVELLLGWEDNNRTRSLEKKFGIKGKEAADLLLHVLVWPTLKDLRKAIKKRKDEAGRKNASICDHFNKFQERRQDDDDDEEDGAESNGSNRKAEREKMAEKFEKDNNQSSDKRSGGASDRNKGKQHKGVEHGEEVTCSKSMGRDSESQVLAIVPLAFRYPASTEQEDTIRGNLEEGEDHLKESGQIVCYQEKGVCADSEMPGTLTDDIVVHTSEGSSLLTATLWPCLSCPDNSQQTREEPDLDTQKDSVMENKDINQSMLDWGSKKHTEFVDKGKAEEGREDIISYSYDTSRVGEIQSTGVKEGPVEEWITYRKKRAKSRFKEPLVATRKSFTFRIHSDRENKYPFSNVEFNVTKDEYSKLGKDILDCATRNLTEAVYSELHEYIKLANATWDVPVDELDKYKVLPRKTGHLNRPPEWILIDLAGWDNVTTIALRADNMYLVGFTDRNGDWHTFNGSERLIPGSTPIEFTGSYADLGGRDMLVSCL